ncbi:hypothetical protein Tcan_01338, partial [Toxocara canis]
FFFFAEGRGRRDGQRRLPRRWLVGFVLNSSGQRRPPRRFLGLGPKSMKYMAVDEKSKNKQIVVEFEKAEDRDKALKHIAEVRLYVFRRKILPEGQTFPLSISIHFRKKSKLCIWLDPQI